MDIVSNYYKSKLYKGRSRFARIFDYIMLRALFFCASYLWFLTQVENRFVCTVLSIIATLMLSIAAYIYSNMKLEKFIIQERKRIRMQLLSEQLMCAPRDELIKIAKSIASGINGFSVKSDSLLYDGEYCYIFIFQSPETIGRDALFKAYLWSLNKGYKHILALSTSGIAPDALSLIERLGHVKVHELTDKDIYAYAEHNGLLADDMTIEQHIKALAEQKKQKRRKLLEEPLSVLRIRKYLIAAAVIWVASYFSSYALYYRVLSGLSLYLAALTFWLDAADRKRRVEV